MSKLLHDATLQQLQLVIQMCPKDWLAFFQQLFPALLLSLELIDRADGTMTDQRPLQRPETAAAVGGTVIGTSSTGTAAIDGQLHVPGSQADASQQQQQQQGVDSTIPGKTWASPSAAAAAAAGRGAQAKTLSDLGGLDAGTAVAAAAAALPPTSQDALAGQVPTAELQQLECLMDEAMTLLLLAYIYNHMPLMAACTYNYVTEQPSVIPAEH